MNINDSDIGRGKRLRQTRKIAKLSAIKLAEKLDVNRATVSLWENGRSGLTMEGARNVVKLMDDLGVKCHIFWLWFGVGPEPYKIGSIDQNSTFEKVSCDLSDPRAEEIIHFHLSSENAVTAKIKSMSMAPFFNTGDIVGGYWEENPAINDAPANCIIELNNKIQVRRVQKMNDKYSISFLSVCNDEKEPFSIEVSNLNKIAIIKRLWYL